MNYGVYQNVRNASWQCLIDCSIGSLPVPISHICEIYGGKTVNNSDVHILQGGQSGQIIVDGNEFSIIVNDNESVNRIRFTIAHELGHYLLGHLGSDITNLNRGYDSIKPIQETEADIFASRLLAPACVLWGINAQTVEQISEVCGISYAAAKIRAERMEVLRKRGKFLTSPLERKVYQQFENYIQNNRL
ncbi:MAG: ImmA/IrrE family metallo-endopeptidase [Oscillospiraceae bacterium]